MSVTSKQRGKRPNNAIDDSVRKRALELVKEHYSDFLPTFAHEKLTEIHGMSFSVETLRQWMVKLWKAPTLRLIFIQPENVFTLFPPLRTLGN